MQLGIQTHADLVEGKPEAELKNRTELAVEAMGMTSRGDGTRKTEDLRMRTWVETGSVDTDLSATGLFLALRWTEQRSDSGSRLWFWDELSGCLRLAGCEVTVPKHPAQILQQIPMFWEEEEEKGGFTLMRPYIILFRFCVLSGVAVYKSHDRERN